MTPDEALSDVILNCRCGAYVGYACRTCLVAALRAAEERGRVAGLTATEVATIDRLMEMEAAADGLPKLAADYADLETRYQTLVAQLNATEKERDKLAGLCKDTGDDSLCNVRRLRNELRLLTAERDRQAKALQHALSALEAARDVVMADSTIAVIKAALEAKG